MYKIVKDGAVVAMTEAPTYIKQQENGCFTLCPEEDAQGVAHAGTPYHLMGRPDMDGAETVTMEQVDAGTEIKEMQAAIDDLVVASLEGGTENV